MSDLPKPTIFPKFSGDKKPAAGEVQTFTQYLFKIHKVLKAKKVLDCVEGATDIWRNRTDEQKELCTTLHSDMVQGLAGRALTAAQKAQNDDLRGCFKALREEFTARTRGKRRQALRELIMIQKRRRSEHCRLL